MPPETSSAQPPHLLQRLVRFWQRPLAVHDDDFAQRYLVYLLSPVLICILTYFTIRYLGVAQFPGYYKSDLLYHHRYALETALNFGFWLYVVEEWLIRLQGPGASRRRRTVGTTCLLWSGGFGIAFVLQLTLIYERIDLYAPRIIHYFDLYPLRRPSIMLRLAIFGSIWCIALSCRLAYGLLCRRFAERNLKSARQTRPSPQRGDKSKDHLPWISDADAQTGTDGNLIFIPNGNLVDAVQPETLACITSEGHYCRFFLKGEERRKEIFTRVALKEVIPKLPQNDFIQIHRSHVINRHYITRLKKSGRSYSLYLDGAENPLPISRYRWPSIRHRIDRFRSTDQRVNY